MLLIHPESHLDHGLQLEHVRFILARYASHDSFFKEEIQLGENGLELLESALYGPLAGDDPILDSEVYFAHRGDRKGKSRMIDLPLRSTDLMTVIGGPHQSVPGAIVLYTAYGGPMGATREPWDIDEGKVDELLESKLFWSKHALAPEPQGL